jgi:hypothetical protein
MLSALQELMLVFLTEKIRIIYTQENYILYILKPNKENSRVVE